MSLPQSVPEGDRATCWCRPGVSMDLPVASMTPSITELAEIVQRHRSVHAGECAGSVVACHRLERQEHGHQSMLGFDAESGRHPTSRSRRQPGHTGARPVGSTRPTLFVLELSSFQLERSAPSCRCTLASVMLNLSDPITSTITAIIDAVMAAAKSQRIYARLRPPPSSIAMMPELAALRAARSTPRVTTFGLGKPSPTRLNSAHYCRRQ